MERNSRKLIQMLERDGWVLDRVNGDHHTFKHPQRDMIITVTHPRRDLPIVWCDGYTSWPAGGPEETKRGQTACRHIMWR